MIKQFLISIVPMVLGCLLLTAGAFIITEGASVRDAASPLVLGALLTAFACWRFYRLHCDYCEAAAGLSYAVEQSKVDPTYVGLTQEDLWLKVLRELNIMPERDEEVKGRYRFDFQGGHFYADIDDSAFANVYYAFIEELDLSDIDEVSVVRRAINETNYAAGINVVYSTSDDSDQMHVHMVQSVLLMPQLPHLKDYVESRLAAFFQLQRRYANIEDKLRIS